jgi:hypothetical protein
MFRGTVLLDMTCLYDRTLVIDAEPSTYTRFSELFQYDFRVNQNPGAD